MSLEYKPSLGFVETAGLVIAIQVADAMAKAAEVEIISAHKVDGLRVCVICKGDVAACQAADWMGAGRVIIHSGALMKRTRREAMDTALRSLKAVIQACDDGGFGHISLCPETMGKINQLGDLDEVLELCTVDERLVPCVDFGHLYARSLGALDGAEAMDAMLDRMKAVLGEARARVFHSHFSHIEFTPNGGEKCHRTFADDGGYGPDWSPLAAAVARRGWSPTFICESAGTQAQDALEMKRIYLRQMQGE